MKFEILKKIVQTPSLHASWLYTLSYLENCGAKKIKKTEDPLCPTLEVLKHGAEEARHAFFFRSKLAKIDANPDIPYAFLGGPLGKNFLHWVELESFKELKKVNLKGEELKAAIYYIVTCIIELRAKKIFSTYEEVLRKYHFPFSIQSIVGEEDKHLADVQKEILKNKSWKSSLEKLLLFEEALYQKWESKIEEVIKVPIQFKKVSHSYESTPIL